MIIAILCFHFSRIGVSKFLNFIFSYWTCGINYFCFASLLLCSFLCLLKKTKKLFRQLFPIILIVYAMFAVCVIGRNFFGIVIAAIFAINIFFCILITIYTLPLNIAKWKKYLLILL